MILLYSLFQNDSSSGEVQIIGGDDLSGLTGKVRFTTIHPVLLSLFSFIKNITKNPTFCYKVLITMQL